MINSLVTHDKNKKIKVNDTGSEYFKQSNITKLRYYSRYLPLFFRESICRLVRKGFDCNVSIGICNFASHFSSMVSSECLQIFNISSSSIFR